MNEYTLKLTQPEVNTILFSLASRIDRCKNGDEKINGLSFKILEDTYQRFSKLNN